MRIWRIGEGFAGFNCARCGEHGFARGQNAPPTDPAKLAMARTEAADRLRVTGARRLRLARWLWACRQPIDGSIAARYVRDVRCYSGPLPGTLGFLPGRGRHHPALIAAFGLPQEIEPGVITLPPPAILGVHITRLKDDGSGKAGIEKDKIMIGHSQGSPIVIAAANDLLGLAIAEGIENALSIHEATGLGAWAAGSASRLPSLASVIPAYADCVTIVVDDDPDGRRHATTLADLISVRTEVRLIIPNEMAAS
jgi:Toprim domain